MEELLRFIVESLIEEKDKVTIEKKEEENAIVFEVSVADEEVGKIIGKNGKVAQAIRAILHSANSNSDKKVIFKIKK